MSQGVQTSALRPCAILHFWVEEVMQSQGAMEFVQVTSSVA